MGIYMSVMRMAERIQDIFENFKKEGEQLLEKIAEQRKSTVFPLLFHIQVSIAPWVTTKIYDCLIKFGEKIKGDVDIILFSKGGDADTAFHIGKMFNRMAEGSLTYIVPRYAASAATLLTFSGDKILMGPPSELSPIDPQIEISPNRFVSARSVREAFNLILREIREHPELPKSTVETFLEKLPLTEVIDYDRLLEHVEELATSLLTLRMVKEKSKAEQIAKKIVREFKYHGRSISIDDAIELGLNVEELPPEQWKLVWEFHKKWETIALISVKEGSEILALNIGNGIAFIPEEKAENKKGKEISLQSILGSKM